MGHDLASGIWEVASDGGSPVGKSEASLLSNSTCYGGSELGKVSFSTTGCSLCVICFSAPASVKTFPCKHAVCCESCLSRSLKAQAQQIPNCPVCRAPVASAGLALSPFSAIAISTLGMQHKKLGSGTFENASRGVRNSWPSWRQSLLYPTVLVIGSSKQTMRNFLAQFSDGEGSPLRGDVTMMNGMQVLPLLTASSNGRLDATTVDIIRNGMRPAAILLLADTRVISSFRQLVICDLQLLDTAPEYAQNVHWILERPERTRSRANLLRSNHPKVVEPDDISAARHYVAMPRPHYIIPASGRATCTGILRLRHNLRHSLFNEAGPINSTNSSLASLESNPMSLGGVTSGSSGSYDTASGSQMLRLVPHPMPPRSSLPPPESRRRRGTHTRSRSKLLCCASPTARQQ